MEPSDLDTADDYYDYVSITLYPLEDPITPDLNRALILEPSSDDYRPVKSLVFEVRSALEEAGVTDCVVLERRRTESDWGASGVAEAIVVGVATPFFVEAVKYVANRFKTSRAGTSDPMSEDEAVQWSRQAVVLRFNVDGSALEHIGTTSTSASIQVRLQDASWTYTVESTGTGAATRSALISRDRRR